LIPIDWVLAYFYNGPCGYFGVQACDLATTFYSILASFIFQFMAVKGKVPSAWEACGLIFCVSLPLPTALAVRELILFVFISTLHQITYQSLSDESAAILDLVNEMRPEYDANSYVVEGTTKFRSASQCRIQSMFPGHMDIRSIKICTVMLLLGGCFWPFNMLMLLGGTTAMFSPIVALYYVDPYKNAVLSVFRMNRVSKVSTLITSKDVVPSDCYNFINQSLQTRCVRSLSRELPN
ncbi:hypothetical protein PRIPAC_96365, partial [Pristionchus pacificus]|uniref:G protein-coupled receptor n=1 Tax=Pristionchus pacificus TaxID=54126 RepID=A0A2A6BIW7_PRIPA